MAQSPVRCIFCYLRAGIAITIIYHQTYIPIKMHMPATKPHLIILSYYDPGSGFFTVISNLASAFIILNANKISERKRIDLTLHAFHLFSNNKPDVRLYLHHSHITPEYYTRLVSRLQTLGLNNNVMITPPQTTLMPKKQLNRLYNACDIGINTSAGEGWGLVSFEHAAANAAQIVPDHSACTELWKGNAEMISPKGTYQPKDGRDTLMQEIDVLSAVDALNRLYVDKTYR